MGKTVFSLVSVVVMLSLASTSYGLVLGDFEDGMTGWDNTWEGKAVLSIGTIGATSGTHSLVLTPVKNAFSWALRYNCPAPVDTKKYKTLTLDVTWVATEWAGSGSWVQFNLMAINSDGKSGWQQSGPSDTTNPSAPGGWDPVNWGTQTRTLTWDISKYDTTGATWMQFVFSTNMGGLTTVGNYYIDNVKLLTGPAPVIEFVDEYIDTDANGVRDDQGVIDMLKAQGYTVNVRSDPCSVTYWKNPLDDARVALLNAADLVIIGRTVSSGNYSTAPDPNKWNAVTKPMILLSPAVAMNSRWKILNNATQTNLRLPALQALIPTHPIFTGVQLDPNNQIQIIDPAVGYRTGATGNNGMTTVLGATSAGNGKLIATVAGVNAYVWVAEWDANATTPYYTGAGQYPGGHRLTFFFGTQENKTPGTGITIIGQGCNNLNADGQRMFLNAVRYMLGIQASAVAVTNASFELPGTTKQNCWDGGTNAKGTFVDVPGWSSDTMAQDSGVEQGGPTDGLWTGFIMGTDPSVWNLTAYTIEAGDAFVLYVDAKDNWTSTPPAILQVSLFSLSAGQRVTLAAKAATLTSSWSTVVLPFNASEIAACVGHKIGIEIKNASNATTNSNSWLGLDNVRLANLAGR